jgi:hypothetical protein
MKVTLEEERARLAACLAPIAGQRSDAWAGMALAMFAVVAIEDVLGDLQLSSAQLGIRQRRGFELPPVAFAKWRVPPFPVLSRPSAIQRRGYGFCCAS